MICTEAQLRRGVWYADAPPEPEREGLSQARRRRIVGRTRRERLGAIQLGRPVAPKYDLMLENIHTIPQKRVRHDDDIQPGIVVYVACSEIGDTVYRLARIRGVNRLGATLEILAGQAVDQRGQPEQVAGRVVKNVDLKWLYVPFVH